jgi:hypothetical protein
VHNNLQQEYLGGSAAGSVLPCLICTSKFSPVHVYFCCASVQTCISPALCAYISQSALRHIAVVLSFGIWVLQLCVGAAGTRCVNATAGCVTLLFSGSAAAQHVAAVYVFVLGSVNM